MNVLNRAIDSENWEETLKDSWFSLSEVEKFIDESYKSGYDAKDEETKSKLRVIFDMNILQTNQITEKLLAYLKELNIQPIAAYLKIDNIYSYSIIVTVGLEDYISSQLLKAYDWVNHTEKETRTKNYTIDLSFMHGDEHLDLECLNSDGYKFKSKMLHVQ
ncbi:hypothetical protein [Pedobacter sp. L105]|uniref:hypothetical protein n=1 Tax=Pedobacter sp. L105 TaxID=1641871 RepID=UPI00131DD76E|nr:hypothetical protein [Pedobacter sp. L105]